MPASSHNTIGFESSDLVTTNAETTGITMSVLKAFHSTVATLPNTGNNTGVYPDIIVRTAFRVNNTSGETPFLRFNGLISGRVYEIDILGNSSIENSITQYIVTDSMGSQSISKLITNNYVDESALAKFTGKIADENGNIYIDLKNEGEDYFAIINAVVLREYEENETTNPEYQRIMRREYISNSTHYNGKTIGLEFYLPQEFIDNPIDNYPVMFWHHGSEEYGQADYVKLRSAAGYPQYLNSGNDVPYIVISPQAPGKRWDLDFVEEYLAFAKTIIPEININHIAVSGWSQGYVPRLLLVEQPERVAVALIFAIGTGIPLDYRCPSIAEGAAVWLFVAQDDPKGYGSQTSYWNTLKNCPDFDNSKHKMTFYASGNGVGHNCVTNTLNGIGHPVVSGSGYTPYPNNPTYTVHDFVMDNY